MAFKVAVAQKHLYDHDNDIHREPIAVEPPYINRFIIIIITKIKSFKLFL